MYIIAVTYHNSDPDVFVSNQTLEEIDQEWTPKFQWNEGYEMNFEEGDSVTVYAMNLLFPTEPILLDTVAFISESNENGYHLHIV